MIDLRAIITVDPKRIIACRNLLLRRLEESFRGVRRVPPKVIFPLHSALEAAQKYVEFIVAIYGGKPPKFVTKLRKLGRSMPNRFLVHAQF